MRVILIAVACLIAAIASAAAAADQDDAAATLDTDDSAVAASAPASALRLAAADRLASADRVVALEFPQYWNRRNPARRSQSSVLNAAAARDLLDALAVVLRAPHLIPAYATPPARGTCPAHYAIHVYDARNGTILSIVVNVEHQRARVFSVGGDEVFSIPDGRAGRRLVEAIWAVLPEAKPLATSATATGTGDVRGCPAM